MSDSLDSLVLGLFEAGAIRFDGPFTLKSGVCSPYYLDLRVIISRPSLLQQVSDAMYEILHKDNKHYDLVCGVPYTALPIATALSLKHSTPMLMKRKEAKAYGTKKQIEGLYEQGQTCLVIEDLVTSGMSVFETVRPLQTAGLKVKDVIVLIDREQGGRLNIESNGLQLHSVMTVSALLEVLLSNGKIDATKVASVKAFIAANQVPLRPASSPLTMSFETRALQAPNRQAQALLTLMARKKSNLCFSADLTRAQDLLDAVEQVAPQICLLKTHVDIIEDFTPALITRLQFLAEQHDFLIFEDRKFADIGTTVQHQFSRGIYKISSWAHITNAHAIPGPGIIDGLRAADSDKGLLILAEMSSSGTLATGSYTESAVKMAENNADFVMGFICLRSLSGLPGMVHMAPGVQLAEGDDALGQIYRTPQKIVAENGSDVIIVGRGIYACSDRRAAARKYREAGWSAYEQRIRKEL